MPGCTYREGAIATGNIIEGLFWFGGVLIWSCAVSHLSIRLHRRWTHPCECPDCLMHGKLMETAAWERGFNHAKALADKRELNRRIVREHVKERES